MVEILQLQHGNSTFYTGSYDERKGLCESFLDRCVCVCKSLFLLTVSAELKEWMMTIHKRKVEVTVNPDRSPLTVDCIKTLWSGDYTCHYWCLFPLLFPGCQALPEYLLQAAGPPGARARPTSTAAARASTASTRTSLFNMPAATTEVRDAPHCPDSHALWDAPRKTELVEANGWLGHLSHVLRPSHLVAPLTQTDKAAEEPGPSLHQC